MAVVEVTPAYLYEYHNEGTSLRFAAVPYEMYLTSGTDLHGIPCFVAQHHLMCKEINRELRPKIPGDEDEQDFEGRVMVEKPERTGVCGKLCVVQDACRAERWKVSSCVIEVIQIPASVRTA